MSISRKVVMRREKVIVAGGIYHITQRAPGKELLFVEEGDYLRFIYLLKDTLRDFSISLFCFSLLPNHLHLLLKIEEENLDLAMKRLFERYAKYFNTKYQRKGHVFCGVYRASYCDSDEYLLTASFYIHLNGYKAGLARSPLQYRWHSLDVYLKPTKKSFLDHKVILHFLSPDLREAKRLYREYLNDLTGVKYSNIVENRSALKDFYLSFLQWLWNFKVKKSDKNIPHKLSGLVEIEKSIELFRNHKAMTIKDKKAYLYLVEQLLSRGFTAHEIAKRLNRTYRSIHSIIQNRSKLHQLHKTS